MLGVPRVKHESGTLPSRNQAARAPPDTVYPHSPRKLLRFRQLVLEARVCVTVRTTRSIVDHRVSEQISLLLQYVVSSKW